MRTLTETYLRQHSGSFLTLVTKYAEDCMKCCWWNFCYQSNELFLQSCEQPCFVLDLLLSCFARSFCHDHFLSLIEWETKCSFNQRSKDHQRAVMNCDTENNEIAKHCWEKSFLTAQWWEKVLSKRSLLKILVQVMINFWRSYELNRQISTFLKIYINKLW